MIEEENKIELNTHKKINQTLCGKLIEQDKIIKLSKLDSEVFFAALEKVPSANKKLKAAFEKHQKAI